MNSVDIEREVANLRVKLDAVKAQRDLLLLRASQAVLQGLTEPPYELLPGEPLRAQLILLAGACREVEKNRA